MREQLLAPSQAWALVQDGRAQLIDLRARDDPHPGVRIPGARTIALEELARELVTIDRERPVVFLSVTGRKARGAMKALRAAGMAASAVEGGIRAWVRDGLPIETLAAGARLSC
jgi:rhodanese-related sulfurtransferase